MSDNFEKHVGRLKTEKGAPWASTFDQEFAYFELCHLAQAGRELAGMSLKLASKESGVSERDIALIEREKPGMPAEHFDALIKLYTRVLAERSIPDREVSANRLGALIASMNPKEDQFAGQH